MPLESPPGDGSMNVEQHGTPRHHSQHWRGLAWFLASIAAVVAAVLLGAMIGPAGPPAWRVPLAFLDHLPGVNIDSGVSEAQWSLVWNIRMPRVILAGIVGAMLSVGGAAYQGVFRNPLVDPYLLGAAAGAGLGATLMIAVWGDIGRDWPVAPVPVTADAPADESPVQSSGAAAPATTAAATTPTTTAPHAPAPSIPAAQPATSDHDRWSGPGRDQDDGGRPWNAQDHGGAWHPAHRPCPSAPPGPRRADGH